MSKLLIELVPKTCLFSNVRTLLPKFWTKLRQNSYTKAKNRCEICKETGKEQGYKHNVECHEIWEYDDVKLVQRLIGLISLCPGCHQVKHFGRTSAVGKQKEAFKRLEKVNNWTHKECLDHLAEITSLNMYRSQFKWKLDISVLSEICDIPKKLITEAEKKRN